MTKIFKSLTVLAACSTPMLPGSSCAQGSSEIRAELVTADRVDTCIGSLEFKDGVPSMQTVDKVHDKLHFTDAFDAFMNTY
jgi:hypothetical protein